MAKKIYGREAEQQIERMLVASNVKKLSELAEFLGERQSTLSSWKSRGIPEAKLFKAASLIGCHVEWLRNGEGEMLYNLDRPIEDADWSGKDPGIDRDLVIEAAAMIQQIQTETGRMVRPEKLGELILMVYDIYARGDEVKKAEVIQWVRLAA